MTNSTSIPHQMLNILKNHNRGFRYAEHEFADPLLQEFVRNLVENRDEERREFNRQISDLEDQIAALREEINGY